VIACTFARIFFRNAINIGLPILECPQAVKNTDTGDIIEVDLAGGIIRNITKGMTFYAEPFPPFMRRIIDAGGLIRDISRG
jgi:3-isopropylmalate/(R)-2-methylmalate dehydratase small subunit